MGTARTALGYVTPAVRSVAELQVLGPVVGLVTVDVVNRFLSGRPPTQHPRHHYSMFGLVWDPLLTGGTIFGQQVDEHITVTVDEACVPVARSSRLTR